ncbi:hypothetical protein J3Q64DRAFT_1699744 [Phycomyces blakesleeanus]|uniref:Uncharacterized protein n=2 Tax=Phycomyces blakesleeanus TaxID=4837 RepID=A0A162U666_PHYB8|nr:hypothetical protein PHYBLDRAFT_169593 [Phycomyces blakesleeanus NRRL 1555(-)]OAD72643.1 hypothetical protein PHYBLDRAFT_169593 [Phycomyces blakesleeanus NRRL 1555(-)]|eukprot:XP_018290683.1 hypothetical protein PHYBLDRAFT_169593 [Phycomyces blakesleeanus NRRL 1555(-)]
MSYYIRLIYILFYSLPVEKSILLTIKEQFTPSVLRNPQFFSYKNRYNSLFPVFPPLPPGFLSVVLGFRHVFSCACFFSVLYAQRPFHCSHGEVLHVKFMYQVMSSVQFRFAFKHKYFLNPTQLSASVQCPVPSCFLAQLLTTILLMVSSYHVWSTECVQSMLMERCTENQLSILHPSQLTARTLDIGSPDFVLWGMSRLSQKGAKLDMRDEPEAKLRCLSKCYAVHLGVSDTCPEQFGIKAFHRYFAVMTRSNNGHHVGLLSPNNLTQSVLDKIGFRLHSFDISIPGHRK